MRRVRGVAFAAKVSLFVTGVLKSLVTGVLKSLFTGVLESFVTGVLKIFVTGVLNQGVAQVRRVRRVAFAAKF